MSRSVANPSPTEASGGSTFTIAPTIYRKGPLGKTGVRSVLRNQRSNLRKAGLWVATLQVIEWVIARTIYRAFHSGRTFSLDGVDHSYLIEPQCSERSVEIPLALEFLRDYYCPGMRVLEVGNVLGARSPIRREIVDKYEVAPGVTNLDVMDIPGEQQFDLIVSISILEHVGFDEELVEPTRGASAVKHLATSCLRLGGRFFFTVPLFYNLDFDRALLSDQKMRPFLRSLVRYSRLNLWREEPLSGVERRAHELRYGRFYASATAIVVAQVLGLAVGPAQLAVTGEREVS
jgi:hypothetical protein